MPFRSFTSHSSRMSQRSNKMKNNINRKRVGLADQIDMLSGNSKKERSGEYSMEKERM